MLDSDDSTVFTSFVIVVLFVNGFTFVVVVVVVLLSSDVDVSVPFLSPSIVFLISDVVVIVVVVVVFLFVVGLFNSISIVVVFGTLFSSPTLYLDIVVVVVVVLPVFGITLTLLVIVKTFVSFSVLVPEVITLFIPANNAISSGANICLFSS